MISRLIRFSLENKPVIFLGMMLLTLWGLVVAPFDWDLGPLNRDPVSVDAIPDLGENQQIVFTEWRGRSPRDVEDQVTFPLTSALLGIPQVRTVRSFSFLGFSTIYIIFNENAEFYWSRSRILEKLSSLPPGLLPSEVKPSLGPDATGLGQVFWYTLEGRDSQGNPAGGWDQEELRHIQDWTVRYALTGVEGVAEVGSVGGFSREYQVEADPDLMAHYGVTLAQLAAAVKDANQEVGARTIEINSTEHLVRGVGFLKSPEELAAAVITSREGVPVTIGQVARVVEGPGLRRGILDKEGAPAVGGVVVVRFGANPLETINRVKTRISELGPSLPEKHLDDGRVSKVTVVPFYDRSGLIYETLGTLESALSQEVLVTIIVVVAMLLHLGSSILISLVLPLAVLMTFVLMKLFGVDANIVALSGIAIAIGTMVDMGIVLSENMVRHLEEAEPGESTLEVIHRASAEVGSAIATALATTVVSFLPVLAMTGAEGKLFKPLAYTKSFALLTSFFVTIVLLPPLGQLILGSKKGLSRALQPALLTLGGLGLLIFARWLWPGLALLAWALLVSVRPLLPGLGRKLLKLGASLAVTVVGIWFLAGQWLPLGPGRGEWPNVLFAAVVVGGILVFFFLFRVAYPWILRWCLDHKVPFLIMVAMLPASAAFMWLGAERIFDQTGLKPDQELTASLEQLFPGLQSEFMPPLDEGSFLLMPTTMPHASIGEAEELLAIQDKAIRSIPEVDQVVGKAGRVSSPLDPAPVSMIETVITYVSEFKTDDRGRILRFRTEGEDGEFLRDAAGELIPDPEGRPFRQWREGIRSPDDIWDEIQKAAELTGVTSAPRLQPIAARLVMLQSGMRAPMGVKVRGKDLETIERVGMRIEKLLKTVPGVKASAVIADRIVGKPYLEIVPDSEAMARYGITRAALMQVIEMGVGGMAVGTVVDGRARYPILVRLQRELRDGWEELKEVPVATRSGVPVPLEQVASLRYVRGPQVIRAEDTFLTGYVTFDKLRDFGEVDVVERSRDLLTEQDRIFREARAAAEISARREGRSLSQAELAALPGLDLEGSTFTFSGNYQNLLRARSTLVFMVPIALVLILLILYLQFKRISTSLMVFSGVVVAWSGGFILIWLYGRGWFLDLDVMGANLRDLFRIGPIKLSVAVWVGFIALFGIATDDGVVIGTHLKNTFSRRAPTSVAEIRAATLEAGQVRVRACLMTTATTILALVPVLGSTGRGSDILVPMALPTFGGMLIAMLTMFVVPVIYAGWEEIRLGLRRKQ